MYHHSIFYKNKTFFLFLCIICCVSFTNVYARENNDKKNGILTDTKQPVYSLWAASSVKNATLTESAAKDSILFVFEHHEILNKSIKYSFKIDKIAKKTSTAIDLHTNDWSHWLDQNEKKYLLSPGEYTIYVKIKSDSIPEQLAGQFPVVISGSSSQAAYWWFMIPLVLLAAAVGFLYGKRRRKKVTDIQPQDNTVDNYTPSAIPVDTLKEQVEGEKSFFQKFDMVTVLFADIEGFSEITDSVNPEILINELNSFFFYFDTVVDRYHIEKIKTMGDAYMCAGGIPQKNHTNPVEVVLAALEVQNYLNRLREQNPNVWSVRIGIHTGQVIAGMLGHKKLSFDIWGHTVNLAARLESSCKAGKINISGTTYELVKHFFECDYHGPLPDKSVDDVSYYVKGLKPEFVDENSDIPMAPNHDFFVQLQLLRLHDLEEYVKSKMETGSSSLYFHNFKHACDVYGQVELLGHSENVSDENMLLLKTAALFHDIGYIVSYENARVMTEKIVRGTLPLFQYQPQQINEVCRLIRATYHESEPVDILEQIMHDANLMYCGRVDFITNMINLFREQQEYNIQMTENEWFQLQIKRLSNHRFYTHAAEKFVSVSREKQLADTEKFIGKLSNKS